MIREMKNIFKHTGGGAKFICLLLLRCPFDAASNIIYANFFKRAFDAVEGGGAAALNRVCLMFLIGSCFLFLYNGAIWRVYAPFVTRIEGRLRRRLFAKICSFSFKRIESASAGEWLTRLNADVEMPFSRPLHLPHFVCAIVNIGVSAAILLRMNPFVFKWVVLFVVPHIAVSQFFIARAMPELNKKSLEARGKNTDALAAFINCADTCALYGAENYLSDKFNESSLEILSANMKIHFKNAFGAAILPFFGLIGYFTLIAVSSGRIADGQFTFGDLMSAFQYRGGVLLGAFMLINSVVSIKASMAGIKRINYTMREDSDG